MQKSITEFLVDKAVLIKKLTWEIHSTETFQFDNPIETPDSDLYADELIFPPETKQSEQILQKIIFFTVYHWIFFALKVQEETIAMRSKWINQS